MPWSTSDRRQRLPKDWPKRRAAVRRRACGRCEGVSLHGEPRWHDTDCDGIGTECDHVIRGDDHSLTNLQWLSEPCHKAKTAAEAREAKRKRSGRRQPMPHPGLL